MSDDVPLSSLLILVILICFSAFFSASETALMSLNRIRVRHRAEQGERRAVLIRQLLFRPNRLLSAILIGNNLVNIAASALATDLALRRFGSAGTGIATGVMTLVILTLGEILPKSLAAHYSELVASSVAPAIRAIMWLLSPLVAVFSALSSLVLRIVARSDRAGQAPEHGFSLEEIRMMVALGGESGTIDEEQEDMLSGVVDLEETEVREIIVPRPRIVSIPRQATVHEAAGLLARHGFSKLPVYEGEPDNIIGVIFGQDVLKALLAGQVQQSVGQMVRPVLTVPETMKARRLLGEMKKSGCTVAIAVDEFGTMSGMVTFHDLVGEVLGDIPGPQREPSEPELRQIDERHWQLSGEMSLRHLNRELDLDLPEEEIVTVGGLVFHLLGRLPRPGDEVAVSGVKLRVLEVRERQVRRLLLTMPEPGAPEYRPQARSEREREGQREVASAEPGLEPEDRGSHEIGNGP